MGLSIAPTALAQVSAGLHPLMQKTHDFEEVAGRDSEIENMDRPLHPRLETIRTHVAEMQASDAWCQL